MVQIPDSFLLGSFVGTIFGLILSSFLKDTTHQKTEIRFLVPENVIICDKKTLEKLKNINTEIE